MAEHAPIHIVADDRERDSGVADILRARFRLEVTETRLAWGDYLIGEHTAIERKTAQDFAQSVIDGRLFRQLQRMRENFENICVIIEGTSMPLPITALHPHALKGALLSTMLAWQVPVVCSADPADTALTLWLMAEQVQSFRGDVSLRPGRKPKRFRTRQLHVLQGLPYVGPALAVRLLDRFGSIEEMTQASIDQLRDVAGMGLKKARAIKDVVSASVPPTSR